MNKGSWIALSVAVVLVIGILVWWIIRKPADCAFSGWEKSVGVSLSASVSELEAVKTTVGITDSQVRDFDSLLKDYAIKYDAACSDVRAELISKEHYTCIRGNMDAVLDDVRRFVQAVEAAKSIPNASDQKQILLDALETLRQASRTNYALGCVSLMGVSPNPLSFVGRTPERSILITNSGNVDVQYSVVGCPEGFLPSPPSGTLPRNTTAAVALQRTVVPVSVRRPLTFLVRSNMNSVVEVAIDVERADLDIWLATAAETTRIAAPEAATVDDALQVINAVVPSDTPDSRRLVYAASTLLALDRPDEAERALEKAASIDPQIDQQIAPLMVRGLVAAKQRDPQRALTHFTAARGLAPADDTVTLATLDLFSGTIMLDRGKEVEAANYLSQQIVAERSVENPALLRFSGRALCPENSPRCGHRKVEAMVRAAERGIGPHM